MSQEKKPATEKKSRPTYKSTGLGRYLAILFAAAFLMLLLAYFMQLRTSEETLGSLKQSLTSIESLDDLIKENQSLHDKIDQLEDTCEELEETCEELENTVTQQGVQILDLTGQTEALRLTALAWETFYQIETLYQNKDYEACAQLMTQIYSDGVITIPLPVVERFEAIEAELTDKGHFTRPEA